MLVLPIVLIMAGILGPFFQKIIKIRVFFRKSDVKQKKNPARQHRHRRQSVYPPTPPFFFKIRPKIKKSKKCSKFLGRDDSKSVIMEENPD